LGISINAVTDASNFIFTGTTLGYDFSITNFNVTIDNSTHLLVVDEAQGISYAKYPNSAMLGYVLKINYPASITNESLMYINLKHVPTTLTYYDVSTGDLNSYVKYTKTVDAGNNFSSNTIISAGDYLNYVAVNNLWEQVGKLRVWLGTEDPTGNSGTVNLIPGFFVVNPQTFPVQLEYMILQ